jgi:predicted transcriptional regulator
MKMEKIEKWREGINKNFPELCFPAEVGLSVLSQLFIKDISNPFGLVYVDVPSSGKTITLNFFSNIKDLVYPTDNFTPASFVSHASNVKKEDLSKIDLLPKIKRKLLLVRDLCSIFGEREEDLKKNLSTLTRVFDGEGLETDSGIHGKRGYKGDYLFMFLAASTPIPPRVWKAMGNFGSRLFFLNIDSQEKNDEDLSNQLSTDDTLRKKEEICREDTKLFVGELFSDWKEGIEWNRKSENPELMRIIGRAALLLCRLRGTINVWKDRKEEESFDYTVPIIERPDRINQQLYNLARGHALVCRRKNINEEDINLILEVVFDSAPPVRSKIFHLLLKKKGKLSAEEIMASLSCSRPTALKEMETLRALDIVEIEKGEGEIGRPEKIISLKEQFKWFLGKEYKELKEHTQGQLSFINSPQNKLSKSDSVCDDFLETKNPDIEIIEKNTQGSPTLIKATIYGRKELFIMGNCLKCSQEDVWVWKGNDICYECHKGIEATDKKTEEES